jgi:sulfhydrogenase subunit alpha
VLHVYFLAVPDFMGTHSVLPLAKSHPEVVRRALKLKKLANDYTAVFGGRALHPMSNTLKGWRKLPSLNAIEQLRERVIDAIPDIQETIQVARTLKIPDYERETEYVSLTHPDEYALYDGTILSSDMKRSMPVSSYRSVTNEFTVETPRRNGPSGTGSPTSSGPWRGSTTTTTSCGPRPRPRPRSWG